MLRGVGHVPMTDDPELIAKVLLQGSAPVATIKPLAAAKAARKRVPRSVKAATA